MDELDFRNKVVIVTGASSGIGAETAKLFAQHNAILSIIGRNKTRLTHIARECEATNGIKPLCLQLDLTAEGSCETVINRTLENFGKIDVLVNCAGKAKVGTLFDQSMSVFDELMLINLRVPYELAQLALPHLTKTKGNIVNVGTSILKTFRPGFLAYSISKAGLEMFTRHAASELITEGVRVNTVSPGVTRTNILKNFNIHVEDQDITYKCLASRLPNGTVIEPSEVALLICVTASDMFPNVNGSDFLIDGGCSKI